MSRNISVFSAVAYSLAVVLCVSIAGAADNDVTATSTETGFVQTGIALGAYGDHQMSRDLQDQQASVTRPELSALAVLLGYDFGDRMSFASEFDLAPAIAGEESAGIGVAELSFALRVFDTAGLHFGRVVLPSSVENLEGDPVVNATVVESGVATSVVPSGAADGIGVVGSAYGLDYAAYVTDGLDVSAVNSEGGLGESSPVGIGSGTDPAVMARVSWEKRLRSSVVDRVYVGGFAYAGNGVSTNWSGQVISAQMQAVSMDVGCEVGPVSVHGLLARSNIQNASNLGAEFGQVTPSNMTGVDLQAWTNVFPDSWNHGYFSEIQVSPHVRYEYIASDASVSPVVAMSLGDVNARDINEAVSAWTVGVSVLPISEVAIRLDYRREQVKTSGDINSAVHLGFGWVL
jgi:hypothetical protein